jgi:hypothetical protein
MYGFTPTDELLNQAFQLAHFILGDRTAAIYVAMAAIDKLKTAATIQDRRLYYMPTGRSAYPAARTKVSLRQIHLLQRLIYTESEPFERLIESREKPLRQCDMIIRFIKHLVRLTTKHNSFYVALGLSRLLYNYTTSETTEIYNLVIQDPDRGRDDYYYRSRKKHLLQELKERFDDCLKTYRGYRGEERFQTQEDSARYLDIVKECLYRFTPWESFCVLPADIEPTRNIITPLLFRGEDPDEEHQIELNRIHTLLHPDCFERLVMTLGLDAPAQRLEVPYFFISSHHSDSTDDRFTPSALNEGEVETMRRYLEKTARHRKEASKRLFSVLVDGNERACFAVDQTSGVRINVEEHAELIEVRSLEEGEAVPLALHVLAHPDAGVVPAEASVRLGRGQRLSFTMQSLDDASDALTAAAQVSINYREAKPNRLVSWLRGRFNLRLFNETGLSQWSKINYRPLALGLLLVATCTAGFLIYLQSRKASPEQQFIAEQKEAGKPEEQPNQPSEPSPSPPVHDTTPTPRPKQPPSRPGSTGEIEVTRGSRGVLDSAMLLAVKRVYIDPLGNDPLSQQVRDTLINNLQSGNRLALVEAREEADAVFKGSARLVAKGREKVSIALRLVNARGQVIWSRTYSGNAAEAAGKIIQDLLADMKRLEAKR